MTEEIASYEVATYVVQATLTTTIQFSPMKRERKLTQQDAIENAMGTLPDDWFTQAENEGWSVEFTAEREA